MLWQQIRHSKEQQTFSTSSNRAALSAPTPAVWCYCSQAAALRICFIYTVHRHTQECTHANLQANVCKKNVHVHVHTRDKSKHYTHWSPTVVRVYQHLVTSGREAASWRQALLSLLGMFTVCVLSHLYVCVWECVGGWVGGCVLGYVLPTSGV